MSALLIVDVQNDFCEGGALPCSGGIALAARIRDYSVHYSTVIASKDWHIDPGDHFSPHPDYVHSWPPHCVAGSPGAELHPALEALPFTEVFCKGHYSGAYSAFEGITAGGTGLATWLKDRGITELDIVGIAGDFCVKATAIDAANHGFTTTAIVDLIVNIHDYPQLAAEYHNHGIHTKTSETVLG